MCASVNRVSIGSDHSWLVPSHHLNQCWVIVNSTPRDHLRWNVNQNNISFTKMHIKISSAKRRSFCPGGGWGWGWGWGVGVGGGWVQHRSDWQFCSGSITNQCQAYSVENRIHAWQTLNREDKLWQTHVSSSMACLRLTHAPSIPSSNMISSYRQLIW